MMRKVLSGAESGRRYRGRYPSKKALTLSFRPSTHLVRNRGPAEFIYSSACLIHHRTPIERKSLPKKHAGRAEKS